jgi:hypothetical protein
MPADLRRRLLAIAALGLGSALWLGARASLPPAVYFLHDQRHYVAMADGEGAVPAPFAWRLLPSAVVRASGLRPDTGFHALTVLTLALVPPAIAVVAYAAGASAASALIVGGLAALAPPVAGYLSWDYIRPDGVSLLLIAVSAWAAIRARPLIFLPALVALSLTKETWVIAAAFALMWSRACTPSFWRWALAGSALALLAAVFVRLTIAVPEPYSLAANVRDLYSPIDARTIARRLLLATAATWTFWTPLAALGLARRVREPRAWALGAALLIATAQVLVAIDTQRLVAAALPFVLVVCAWELDRMTPAVRAAAAGILALGQLPWLLAYARIWTPPLRGVEILLLLAAAAVAVIGLRAPQRSFTM